MPAPTTSTSTVGSVVIRGAASSGAVCTDRLVYVRQRLERKGDAWRSWIGSGRRSRCPSRWSSRTGFPRSATSTRTSTRWRPSCCGRGSGRWRAGSRRSRSRATSSSTRSSTSRSSCCAPTTWGCARSRTPAAIAASRSSRAAGRARAGSRARSTGGATASTARTPHVPRREDVRRAQPAARRHRPRAGAVRGVGRVRVDQPRRRRAAVAGVHRAVRHDPRRVEGRVAADRVVVRVPSPGELEARRARRSSSSTTWWRRIPSCVIPGRGIAPRDRRAVRPARVHRRGHPLPAHDERRHGRDGARERRAHRRGPARHRAAGRPGAGDRDLEPHAQRRGRELAPGPRARHPRPQRARRAGAQRDRSATASRTTSCCRCTAAPPRTASARSDRRRR